MQDSKNITVTDNEVFFVCEDEFLSILLIATVVDGDKNEL